MSVADKKRKYGFYLTRTESMFFQNIANMLWKQDIIRKPSISIIAKMALNMLGKQYLQQEEQLNARDRSKKICSQTKNSYQNKSGPVNHILTDEKTTYDYFGDIA